MGTLVFQATLGGSVNLIGPNIAGTVNFTLPSADGTSGQALATNGSGTLAFSSFATLTSNTFSGSQTLSGGTANGVTYLNGSKVLTSGSALTFDGTLLRSSTYLGLSTNTTPDTSSGDAIFYKSSSGATLSGYQVILETGSAGSRATRYTVDNTGQSIWAISGSEQMRLTSTGLGIGTSNPLVKLDVQATAAKQHLTSTTGTNSAYQGYFNTGNSFYVGVDSSTGSNFSSAAYASVIWSNNAYPMIFATNNAERMRIDSSGNLGLGVTPSAWTTFTAQQIGPAGGMSLWAGADNVNIGANVYYNAGYKRVGAYAASSYQQGAGAHYWNTAGSSTAGSAISFTTAMTLDASGNWSLGTTNIGYTRRMAVTSSGDTAMIQTTGSATSNPCELWNTATSGNNQFLYFYTEGTPTTRGSITYNRGAGLTAYNITSDYRAKDISGPVIDSGTLIDSVPVYMGKMKGATQERPMFIAHETPSYAHTGEKDAVDADGNPVYQQMDASALIPVMWAEIQSLRKRFANAGIA